jgi:Zn-dependent protease
LLASIACLFVWSTPGNWAALARASAWLNILNLISVWRLDGGQAVGLMTKASG